jgi:hypothetical protein
MEFSMSDEATAPEGVAAEAEVTAPEPVEVAEADGIELEAESSETEAEAPPEEIEFDFGGNKLKVPKGSIPDEIADQLDKFTKGTWSDYTRKSQEVAEVRKSVEARAQAVAKLENLNGEVLSTYSKGLQIKAEIEQLRAIDVNALWQSNPDQARRVSDMMAQKSAEFNATVNQVAQLENGLTQAQEAEAARRANEGEALLERRIKGFSSKVPEIIDYVADSYGIDKSHAAKVWRQDPATAEMAYKAMMFDRMQTAGKKPAAAPQKAAAPMVAMKAKGASPASNLNLSDPAVMAKYLRAGR